MEEEIDTSTLCYDILEIIHQRSKTRHSIGDLTLSFVLDTPLEIIRDFMETLERNNLVRKTTRRTVMIWGLVKNDK
jgi:hypothetical protein